MVIELDYMKTIFSLIDMLLLKVRKWRANHKWITSENIHTSSTLIIFVKVYMFTSVSETSINYLLFSLKSVTCLKEYLCYGGIQMESCLT